jgi:hypothetical protein
MCMCLMPEAAGVVCFVSTSQPKHHVTSCDMVSCTKVARPDHIRSVSCCCCWLCYLCCMIPDEPCACAFDLSPPPPFCNHAGGALWQLKCLLWVCWIWMPTELLVVCKSVCLKGCPPPYWRFVVDPQGRYDSALHYVTRMIWTEG